MAGWQGGIADCHIADAPGNDAVAESRAKEKDRHLAVISFAKRQYNGA
jgi:hypothetical protein